MSASDEEVLRRGWDHFNRTGELDLDLIDPQVEWRTLLGSFDGHDGVRAWAEDVTSLIEGLQVELADLTTVGDRIVTVARLSGAGSSTGLTGLLEFGAVWSFRDGRLVRLESFDTFEEALEAARAD